MDEESKKAILAKSIEADRYVPMEASPERIKALEETLAQSDQKRISRHYRPYEPKKGTPQQEKALSEMLKKVCEKRKGNL